MPSPRSPHLRLVPMFCAVGLACLGQPGESVAEKVRATSRVEIQCFDIPAGELAQMLLNIVHQSRTPIAFNQCLVEGLPAPAIQSSYNVEQVLQRVLQGSGLEYSRSTAGVFSLQRATAPNAALPAAKPTGALATVVVTGTRKADVEAGESLAPIDVVSAEQLRDSGNDDLRDALVRLLPSLSRQIQAYNVSALASAQSLHSLSPNHVLVLVNDKRRHETASINVSGGLQSGSTGVDLDTIPLAAIERIEVLRDGASTQYGPDAIAGVINVILKPADHGGRFAYDNGRYGDGDGLTQNGGVNGGLCFGEGGFLNLSAQFREQARTIRVDIDQCTGCYGNPSIGDPSLHRQALAYNVGVTLDDSVELYNFATYTHRSVSSAQIYQLPSLAPRLYPNGSTPRIISDEDDYSLTLGIRGGELFDAWDWDLSSTYGVDRPEIDMDHSISLALYGETGDSPRSLDLARYKATQWINNLDLHRDFDLTWLSAPLNFSQGLEQRRELCEVRVGDPWPYYNGGSKVLPGQTPASARQQSRDVLGAYLGLSAAPDRGWQLETATRYKHYSDFGGTANGKLVSHYRFSPEVSARASLSGDFRAPSLTQENYTGLGVLPTTASGLLAISSPAARLLGAEDLELEKSISYNLGLVLDPLPDLNLAIDAYRIEIRGRIVDGATYSGQPVIDALRAGGISIPAGLTQVSTHYMTNGADTRTHGLDLTASYLTRLGEWGRTDWRLGANVNRTKLIRNRRGRNGQPLLNDQQQAWITNSMPRSQASLQADWSYRRWGLTLRETRYSKTVSEPDYYIGKHTYSTTVFDCFENSPKYITGVALRYAMSHNLTLNAGANSLSDVKPDKLPAESAYLGFNRYNTYASQISLNDASCYLGATYTFQGGRTMSIELRGSVRTSAVTGDGAFARQATRFLPDTRSRAVSVFDIRQKARLEGVDGLNGALFTVFAAQLDPWLAAGWALAAAPCLRATVAHRPGSAQPTVTARALATLDGLSDRRTGVHLVIGSSDADVRRDGDFTDKDERYQRAVKYLEVFTRALESRDPFDYHGEFYRLGDAGSGFLPIQRPRLQLSAGGSSVQAQRLAVRFADVYAGRFASPTQTAELKRRPNEETAEQGRGLKFWGHLQVILSDSPAVALDIAGHYRQTAFELLLTWPLDELAASPRVARDGERDRLARLKPGVLCEWVANTVQRSFAGVLVGSVGEVAEQTLVFHRVGIEIVQLEATTEDAEDIRLRRQLIECLRRDA